MLLTFRHKLWNSHWILPKTMILEGAMELGLTSTHPKSYKSMPTMQAMIPCAIIPQDLIIPQSAMLQTFLSMGRLRA